MSDEPDAGRGYRNVQETDAWAAEPTVSIDATFTSPISDGWLSDAPRTFDTRHDETARFVATNDGVTPTILQDFRIDNLQASVPMGYTNLWVLEKRAVIADGRIVRLWPRAFAEDATARGRWTMYIADEPLIADRRGAPIAVDSGPAVGHGLLKACALSRLMGGRPVLLGRHLAVHGWH